MLSTSLTREDHSLTEDVLVSQTYNGLVYSVNMLLIMLSIKLISIDLNKEHQRTVDQRDII